jgi:hypothetical protein
MEPNNPHIQHFIGWRTTDSDDSGLIANFEVEGWMINMNSLVNGNVGFEAKSA